MPWNWPIGRPNCTRTLAYSEAARTHHEATPAASAPSTIAPRSRTPAPVSPSSTRSPGTPSESTSTLATPLVRSRLFSGVTVTVSLDRATHSSPRSVLTGSTSTSARAAPSTGSAVPLTVRTPSSSRVPVSVPVNATAPVRAPSARPGRSSARALPSEARITTDASTVGTYGPGAMRSPSASTATAVSSRPKPLPPYSSGRCRPSRPWSARPAQKPGRSSVSAPTAERTTSAGMLRSAQPLTDSRSASCSSLNPIAITPSERFGPKTWQNHILEDASKANQEPTTSGLESTYRARRVKVWKRWAPAGARQRITRRARRPAPSRRRPSPARCGRAPRKAATA